MPPEVTCAVGSLRLCCGAGYQEVEQVDSEMSEQTWLRLVKVLLQGDSSPGHPMGGIKSRGASKPKEIFKMPSLQSCWGTPCFSSQKIVRAFTGAPDTGFPQQNLSFLE